MKCLAQTQGPKIRVNSVIPGLLLTDWVNCTDSLRTLLTDMYREIATQKISYVSGKGKRLSKQL